MLAQCKRDAGATAEVALGIVEERSAEACEEIPDRAVMRSLEFRR